MAVQTMFKVRHSCGHTEEVDLSSRPAEKQKGFAEWLAKKPCRKCSNRGASEEWKAEQVEKIRQFEASFQMGALTGTEKMQSYGRDVRHRMLGAAYEDLVQAGDWSDEDFEERIAGPARNVVAAKFWLDAKDTEQADLEEIIASASEVDGYTCENPE